MQSRYPNVFRPLRLGPVEIPTRFYFAPHGSALSAGTKPSDDLVAYSAERVRDGGCGLVILALAAHERGRTQQPSPHPPENVAAFRRFADEIHAAGGKVFGQIFYWWGGFGRWQLLGPPGPSFGPSVRQFSFGGRSVSTHAMGLDEIEAMHRATSQSARHLREAGFDGVMLHGSHAGLIEQFLSPYFNERSDGYGGSFESRMRFAVESLEAAREGAGPNMAVGIRLNCDEQVAGGYGVETAREVVAALCERNLVDFLDLDVGLEPQQFHHGMPTGFEAKHYYRPFVEKVRAAAGDIPVLSVLGRVTQMAEAEAAIADGVCDAVGAARQLIAEPRFVQNARTGNEDRSRTCIACNWCTAAGGDGAQGCTINPASYRERLWGVGTFKPAAQTSKVVVVGGGPGGLEAARVAALKGHKVVLFETRHSLGGGLALWAQLPGRQHYGQAVAWWAAELQRLGVDIRLGASATVPMIKVERPDAVIVATGSSYGRGGRSITMDADIEGWSEAIVFRPEDVLQVGVRPSGNVFVLDAEGYHTGVGISELLAEHGAAMQFVTAGYSPVSPRLTDSWEERYVVRRAKERGVILRPATWVRRITKRTIVFYDVHTNEEFEEPADAVILVTGRIPEDDLCRQLDGQVRQLFCIGDAMAVRMLAAATYEGQKFARLIGEPDAPETVRDAWFHPDGSELTMLPADIPRPA